MNRLELATMNYEAAMGGPYEYESGDDLPDYEEIIDDLMMAGGRYDPMKPELLQEALSNASADDMAELAEMLATGKSEAACSMISVISREYWLLAAKGDADEIIAERDALRRYYAEQPADSFDD